MTVLIAIAGGSGSGKSTLALALAGALPEGTCTLVSEDWYYHDRAAFADFDPARHDFDDLASRDHGLLLEHLGALKAGRAVTAPHYDFRTHRRLAGAGIALVAAPVVIVEGAHLLCACDLAGLFDLKVFIDAPDDIRFIRRLRRDEVERGRTARQVAEQYVATVRPAHKRLIEPSRRRADLVLEDSSAALDPDPAVIARLAAAVLAHPVMAGAGVAFRNR